MAEALGNLVVLYVLLGAGFGVFFAFVGAARLEPDAADGTVLFKLALIPGAAALWPYLLLRVLRPGHRPVKPSRREPAGADASTGGAA